MKRIAALSIVGLIAVAGIALAGGDKKETTQPASAAAKTNIIDTAVAAGSFKTLAKALGHVGLVDALKGPGPFTVFAPSDEAFAKLPAGMLEELMKPQNTEKLANVLKYHVINGKVMAADVVKMTESTSTLEGQTFDIVVKDGKVSIGTKPDRLVNVVKTDIECTNGVIHVIDAVMLPRK